MAGVDVIHDDGRRGRMTSARLAAAAGQGWRPATPTALIAHTDDTIDAVLNEVGADPAKAAAAIEVEKASNNRPTLISKLEAIAAGATTADSATSLED